MCCLLPVPLRRENACALTDAAKCCSRVEQQQLSYGGPHASRGSGEQTTDALTYARRNAAAQLAKAASRAQMLRLWLSWSHATAHGVRRVHPQHTSELHCAPRLLVRRLFPNALADAAARSAGRSRVGIYQLEVRSSDRALVQDVLVFCRVTELGNVRKEELLTSSAPCNSGTACVERLQE